MTAMRRRKGSWERRSWTRPKDVDRSGGKGMQETLSLALGFFESDLVKKGETVIKRFLGFFRTDLEASDSGFRRRIPS